MMWFFRHFWIFNSYHIFLLNQVEGAIAIPPSNSAPLPLFCPSVCPSVCPSIGLLTTFSGFCTFADKSLGRIGIELEMQMFPDDLPLANIDADGYCCHFMRSSVRPTIHGLGFVYCIQSAWKKWPTIWHADVSRWLTLSIQYTCGYGGYLLPLLAAHSSYSWCIWNWNTDLAHRNTKLLNRVYVLWTNILPTCICSNGMSRCSYVNKKAIWLLLKYEFCQQCLLCNIVYRLILMHVDFDSKVNLKSIFLLVTCIIFHLTFWHNAAVWHYITWSILV